jgi:hypothetical protein
MILGSAQAALVSPGIPPPLHYATMIIENWARTLASAKPPTGVVGCVMQITKIHFATSFGDRQPRL